MNVFLALHVYLYVISYTRNIATPSSNNFPPVDGRYMPIQGRTQTKKLEFFHPINVWSLVLGPCLLFVAIVLNRSSIHPCFLRNVYKYRYSLHIHDFYLINYQYKRNHLRQTL